MRREEIMWPVLLRGTLWRMLHIRAVHTPLHSSLPATHPASPAIVEVKVDRPRARGASNYFRMQLTTRHKAGRTDRQAVFSLQSRGSRCVGLVLASRQQVQTTRPVFTVSHSQADSTGCGWWWEGEGGDTLSCCAVLPAMTFVVVVCPTSG